MNAKCIVAILLVTLGIVVIAYSGITLSAPDREITFLGLYVETTQSHFVPPAVGALALIGGLMLLFAKTRKA